MIISQSEQERIILKWTYFPPASVGDILLLINPPELSS